MSAAPDLRAIAGSDLRVSRIAYGVAALDCPWDGADFLPTVKRAIAAAHDHGARLFDLADIYAFGKAELAFGEVLKERPGLRDEIVIQSKCGARLHPDYAIDGPQKMGFVDTRASFIQSSVEASLKRLGTDRLDILLLHWPDVLTPPEEVAKAFDTLFHQGKVRHFGVCNHGPMRLDLLGRHLSRPILFNQVPLGLERFGAITHNPYSSEAHYPLNEFHGVVDYCQARGICVQAHSPLRGRLLMTPRPDDTPELVELRSLVARIAERHGVHASAIAIAWLLAHPAGILPIVGATAPNFIADNFAASNVTITHEQWYDLLNAAALVQSV